MLQLAEGNVVPLAHLSTSLVNECAFLGSEYVVRIDHALWLNEHTTALFHSHGFSLSEGCWNVKNRSPNRSPR
jgi:hypothetical protein